MKRLVLAAIAGLVLTGCATDHMGHMSSYDAGYKDGCDSGTAWYDLTDVKVKDYSRAMNDRGYFYGWDEGFTECRYNVYRDKV